MSAGAATVDAGRHSSPRQWGGSHLFRMAAFALPPALLAAHVRLYWFLCDDAFISFRYVRNLLAGNGLVFNPGERVEGYTNFLWVVELAALWGGGVRPEIGAHLLSLLATAGVVAAMFLLAARTPLPRPLLAAWMALVLLACNRSVAVWSTGGLETRQFTLLVLLAVLALGNAAGRRRRLVLGSTALGLAALTRPEGMLVGGLAVAWALLDPAPAADGGLPARIRRRVVPAAVPFGALVLAHLGFRLVYYGEWLPNTYHAKGGEPWWEAGWSYFTAAALENGLYLLVPLAVLGAIQRARRGDRTHLLAAVCVLPPLLHVIRIGGDHFEYRMLDHGWPLLFVAAADGLVSLLARRGSRSHPLRVHLAVGTLFVACLVYGNVLQVGQYRLTRDRTTRKETFRMHVPVTAETFAPLRVLPFMPMVARRHDAVLSWCIERSIARRHLEHKVFWQWRRDGAAPYEAVAGTGAIPPGLVMAEMAVGIVPFYLPDVVIIDRFGLTDPVVARNRDRSGRRRVMAHDRKPPPGYLEARGVNIKIRFAADTAEEALRRGEGALRLAEGLWMPFRALRPELLEEPLKGREVRLRKGSGEAWSEEDEDPMF